MHESLNTSWGRDVCCFLTQRLGFCESLDPNYTPGNQTWKLKMDHLKSFEDVFPTDHVFFFIPFLYAHLLEGDMIKCCK